MGDSTIESDSQSFHDNDTSDDDSTKLSQRPALPLADLMLEGNALELGFRQSTMMCLEKIREALLHHRWQEAAEYMVSYSQMIEERRHDTLQPYKLQVWRVATEILHQHSNSTMEDYNQVYELIKLSVVKDYVMISLEHSYHLLLHGHMMEAKRQLSILASWKYGKWSVAQEQGKKLTQAYNSLLDYILWCDKKFSLSNYDNHTSDVKQDMTNHFRQASVNLHQILKHPGAWDPFILSYVEMQEFYGNHEDALKVLNNYAFDSSFPPNPNAHVYLYQYLLKHSDPSDRKLRDVLKSLCVLVPSHELMLDYCRLLLQSEKQRHHQKALEVLLDLLDFACWRRNLDAWKCLRAIIDKLQLQQDWKKVVSKMMSGRNDWWPVLHFTGFHATKDFEEEPELMELKASLAEILCPDLKLKYLTQIQSGMTTS